MARVPLIGGAYTSESIIADAQRCVNMYPENNPKDSPVPVTHYPRPGLVALNNNSGFSAPGRGLFFGSNEVLYGVIGTLLVSFDATWQSTLIGTLKPSEQTLPGTAALGPASISNPVSMVDNGLELVVVDGVNGYTYNYTTKAFAQILDPAWLGADKADTIDSFVVFNQPASRNFYSTLSNQILPLNSLYIAAKNVYPENLQTLAVMRREIWLLGKKRSEVWGDAGGALFPFALVPGGTFDHGCAAKYSVAVSDQFVYWVGRDDQGNGVIFKGSYYRAIRISTHAIEAAIQKYSTLADAIGMTFQMRGHTFYMVHFPTGDATWVWDEATELWHEWTYIDNDGLEHRARPQCIANAYGQLVALDWENGTLYGLDQSDTVFTDNGQPIHYIRSFPHIMTGMGPNGPIPPDGSRLTFNAFIADMETGNDPGTVLSFAPQLTLRMSDDRGRTWNSAPQQGMGAQGQYNIWPMWRNLGMARDRVHELSWSAPFKTALNGAFIDVEVHET